jgi:hypothetical protein
VIQGTFGVIQGTFGVIQGTFGVISVAGEIYNRGRPSWRCLRECLKSHH